MGWTYLNVVTLLGEKEADAGTQSERLSGKYETGACGAGEAVCGGVQAGGHWGFQQWEHAKPATDIIQSVSKLKMSIRTKLLISQISLVC